MRSQFATFLHGAMAQDESLWLLTADIGYGLWDAIKRDFPSRYVDFGAREQLMLGAACGLALSGKSPVAYSITPFLLYRPFEILRNYLDHESIPVKLAGGGRDRDYGNLGFSHWAEDDKAILSSFPHIACFRPATATADAFSEFLNCRRPAYLSLTR